MRVPSLLSSTTPMSQKIWTVFAATVSAVFAIQAPHAVKQPIFDLDQLGRVGLGGDFSGVSLYEFTSQAQSFSNGSQSLLSQLPNGIFTSLELADSVINAMCVYVMKDGTQKGVVVGGNFTSLGGVEAKGIALYNPGDDSVTALSNFEGKVNALLCDQDTNRVYVGGQFSLNQSENAIALEGTELKVLPFEGFTGPVSTITKSNNNTILFGGSFDGLQNFSSPSVKDAQTLNIVSAQIRAEQTSDMAGFNDPNAITCTNGTEKQWLLRDGQRGSWTATFRFELFPTKLRLINANFQGRSTESFRFTAFPLGGILNLTYTDSGTGEKRHCTESCPLAAINGPQDFEFVNVVGMKSFRLDILSFRGAGGGLSSVQLFQDEIFTYAIPELNEAVCAAGSTGSNSSFSGPWTETSINPQGDADYLSAEISSANTGSSKIVFEPHIEQKGSYQVLVHTPGCLQDGTCSTRGKFVVTGTVTKDGSQFKSDPLFQTNNFDKYDIVYEGNVDPADGTFRPTITIAPDAQQTQAVVNIVAQKVQFRLVGDAKGNARNTGSSNSTSSGLNGIYEYNPHETVTTNPADSSINAAGLQLNENASVVAIAVKGDLTYVAGNFTARDNKFQHFFIINKNQGSLPNVPGGGLKDRVNTMLVVGDLIYVGGSFSGTKDGSLTGLAYVGAYDTAKQSWVTLGGGVDGVVTEIVPISLNLTSGVTEGIAVSGGFTRVRPDNNDKNAVSVDGFAVWIPSKNQWLETIGSEKISISGLLSAVVKSNNDVIYAGSIQSNTVSSSGVIYLLHDNAKINVASSSLKFTASNTNSRKRSVVTQNVTGVVTGLFYRQNNKNLTVLGGRFEAQGKDGTVRDLAFIDGASGAITGATNEFVTGSTIMALQVLDKQLFVGGSLEGTQDVRGIAIWDMDQMKLANAQPQPLSGGNVIVYDISNRPDTKDIYVTGDFKSAGSLGCSNLCVYQSDAQQWKDVAHSTTPGTIRVMRWVGKDQLIIGGNMVLNGTTTYLAIFDAKAANFIALDADVSTILGPVTDIAVDSDTSDSFFITGTTKRDGFPYMMKLKDKRFVVLQDSFQNTSEIHNIQILPLKDNSKHQSTNLLSEKYVLMVTGLLHLDVFGNASAVTYDGSSWTPLFLASTANGKPGTISAFFSEFEPSFATGRGRLARGHVILISLAIALALIFLLVACGVLAAYIRRRREGYVPAPTIASAEKSVDMQTRLPPQELFTSQGVGRGGAPAI
ncbi:cortical protein marker for cell polarity-domain-containing protein [Trichophaea hybrida]|nr:cortical protein marker for cell polarity-domain-containing protein [Trichophaea hybrida]